MTHADWLPSCAISFSYTLSYFGGKIFRVDLTKNKPDSGTFYRRFIKTNYGKRS